MKNKLLQSIFILLCLNFSTAYAQGEKAIPSSLVNFTPQFFICIIAGVLLAMGFQVVLTILSLASGVSLIGNLEKSSDAHTDFKNEPSENQNITKPILVKITSAAGIWTIITASVSLFFASLLAVKLSLVASNSVGITLGLVIWAAFFMLMMYLEIKSVSSLLGMVFNTALQGLRYSFSGIQKIFSSSPESTLAKIASNTVADLGKEISHALGDSKIAKKMDKYVKDLKPKEMDYSKIKTELLKIFKDVEVEEKIDKQDIDIHETHLYKIAGAHHTTKSEVVKWAQLLVEAWGIYKFAGPVSEKISSVVQNMTSNGDEPGIREKIEKYLKESGKDELNPERLKSDFLKILKEPKLARELISEKVHALDRSTLVNILASRTDVQPDQINFMVDSVSGALDFVKQKISKDGPSDGKEENEGESRTKKILNKIENKFRDYVTSLDKPGLDYDQVKADFIAIFHNPKATFSVLKNELSQYDRESLIAMLSSRENISSDEAEKLVIKIEEARNFVLTKIDKIENEIKEKTEMAKDLALHEAEVIRKSAATAAWWLFATAVVSGLAAAAGGMLAIT